MKRKKKSFNRLYGDDAKSVMYATANKLAQKEQVHKVSNIEKNLNIQENRLNLKSIKMISYYSNL